MLNWIKYTGVLDRISYISYSAKYGKEIVLWSSSLRTFLHRTGTSSLTYVQTPSSTLPAQNSSIDIIFRIITTN